MSRATTPSAVDASAPRVEPVAPAGPADPPASVADRLRQIADALRRDEPTEVVVRTLLNWFNASGRGHRVVQRIRDHLGVAGLVTDPDFDSVTLDEPVRFALRWAEPAPAEPAPAGRPTAPADEPPAPPGLPVDPEPDPPVDPTFRIRRLNAAKAAVVSVAPGSSLGEVTTLMMYHDYSQLPVLSGSRTLKGVVSWASVGRRMAMGKVSGTASEFMDPHHPAVVRQADESLLSAVSAIVEHGFVLVRGVDGTFSGIITPADLSLQFQQMAEPFMLLGEIERHVRQLLRPRFTVDELQAARVPASSRPVTGVDDLTFGDYLGIFRNTSSWSKLGLAADGGIVARELDNVRQIRNDVMHFNSDGLPEAQMRSLRRFANFLRMLLEGG